MNQMQNLQQLHNASPYNGEMIYTTKEKIYIETDEPSEFDVLCGRDKRCFQQEGNKRFRSLIIMHLRNYKNARSRSERSNVVKTVWIELKKTDTLFLKFDKKEGRWYKLCASDVCDKISHAFRDKHPPRLFCPRSAALPSNSDSDSVPIKYDRVKSNSSSSHLNKEEAKPTTTGSCAHIHGLSPPDTTSFSFSHNHGLSTVICNKHERPHFEQTTPLLNLLGQYFDETDKGEEGDQSLRNTPSHSLFTIPNQSNLFWSSLLENLHLMVEAEAEDKDEEFMDAINTLDFSCLPSYSEYRQTREISNENSSKKVAMW